MSSPRQSDRSFGFMFAIVFAVITGIVWFVTGAVNFVLVGISAGFAAAALVWPTILLPLNRLWQRFAVGVGFVTNHLILGLVLYGMITPVGLFFRLTGRDAMNRSFEPEAQTYFVDARPPRSKESYFRQF